MITGPQIREARVRLGWDSRTLAQRAKIRLASLIRAEGSSGEPAISTAEAAAIERTLGDAGAGIAPARRPKP
ncbi:hypothetical protein [Enterovirga aerilata]|uniref:XRE family transcriptional regulator n=1 Tax=Enterovirga aerilata TaxID=2730920 RepID=A0A849I0Q1_9HYPH|nr:hypothetical protein [Enterovirga sp. DB1703]NNM70971.1 hypothetical protein [Enterovirga sp. DB1703]